MRLYRGVLKSPALGLPWILHGFGTRKAIPSPKLRSASLKQVHSDLVRVVASSEPHLQGDAMITATPGLALAIHTADCLPILLADPEHRIVAAIHAGWRGTLKRIVQKTVGIMRTEFGSHPAKIVAAMGPSIQVCCYEVGPEVISEYHSQFAYAAHLFEKGGPENPADTMLPRQVMSGNHGLMRNLETARAHLNLEEANRRQLLDAGLAPRRIARGAPCTACRTDLLHSYRREGPRQGRLVSSIAIRP